MHDEPWTQRVDVAAEAPDGLAWHYTDGPGLLSILVTHTLWATASPFLNDRQEVLLGGRMVVERLLEVGAEQGHPLTESLAARVRESSEQGEGPGRGGAYILSASSSPDSLAMWRLYGGARESYAIGLDPQAPLAALASHEVELPLGRSDGGYLRHQGWQAVRYRPDDQRALVDAALGHLGDLSTTLGPMMAIQPEPGEEPDLPPDLEAKVEPFLEALQEAILLIKHEGFADERETRYAVVLLTTPGPAGQEAEARLLSYRASAYGIAPYLRLTGADPSAAGGDGTIVVTAPAPLPVRAVAISPSPNGEEATASVRQLLLAHGYDVPVIRSSIPFRD